MPSLSLVLARRPRLRHGHRARPADRDLHLLGLGHRGGRATRSPTTPARTPGRAAVLSTFLLLVTYVLVTVAAVAFAGVGTDGHRPWQPGQRRRRVRRDRARLCSATASSGTIALLLLSASILTSASASTQTTILPTARTTLSMGVYKAVPKSFAQIHPQVPDARRLDDRDGRGLDRRSTCSSR